MSSTRDGEAGGCYHVRISCSYAVQGREYHRDLLPVPPAPGFPDPELARAAASRYRPGSLVQIYYDPANPGEATLAREAPLKGAGIMAGTLMVMLGAVGLALIVLPVWLIGRLVGYF